MAGIIKVYPIEGLILLLEKWTDQYDLPRGREGLNEIVTRFDEETKESVPFEKRYWKDRWSKYHKPEAAETDRLNSEMVDFVAKDLGYSNMEEFLCDHNIGKGFNSPTTATTPPDLTIGNETTDNEIFDKYEMNARRLPAWLALAPAAVTVLWYVGDSSPIILVAVVVLWVLAGLGIASHLAARSKRWENKWYKYQKGFPSTYLLLYEHPYYDAATKISYRNKIKLYRDIDFPPQTEEKAREADAIQALNTAAQFIGKKIKTRILRGLNIRYGFLRNFIPGAILGSTLSVAGSITLFLLQQPMGAVVLLGLGVFYIFYLIRCKIALRQAGEAYAQQLIEVFLSR